MYLGGPYGTKTPLFVAYAGSDVKRERNWL